MRQGSTPTFTIRTDVDLTGASALFITFEQSGRIVLEKTLEDCTISSDKIVVQLSQEETFLFKETITSAVKVQIRAAVGDTRYTSNEMNLKVSRAIKKGEI